MKKILIALVCCAFPAFAHDTHDSAAGQNYLIPAALEQARVTIKTDEAYRYISANGLPSHETGQFPNRGNPNRIAAQSYKYRVALNPAPAGQITQMRGQPFGVALNGIPFDPGTAECYGQPRGGRPGAACSWREEAIVNGQGQLGLDSSNAHVQPNGAYHYHGIPWGLVKQLAGDFVHIGYAADGFKMMVSRSGRYKPSYVLKSGLRPNGPGGAYDGTYTQDFDYIEGAGDLDACNGAWIDGAYVYVLTSAFPFIPRCWVGAPDESFARMPPMDNQISGQRPPPNDRSLRGQGMRPPRW